MTLKWHLSGVSIILVFFILFRNTIHLPRLLIMRNARQPLVGYGNSSIQMPSGFLEFVCNYDLNSIVSKFQDPALLIVQDYSAIKDADLNHVRLSNGDSGRDQNTEDAENKTEGKAEKNTGTEGKDTPPESKEKVEEVQTETAGQSAVAQQEEQEQVSRRSHFGTYDEREGFYRPAEGHYAPGPYRSFDDHTRRRRRSQGSRNTLSGLVAAVCTAGSGFSLYGRVV